MKGYLKNPNAPRKRLRGRLVPYRGPRRHAARRLCENPRSLKDIIISGGENISSIEVEETLYRHPAVLSAAVVASRTEMGRDPAPLSSSRRALGDGGRTKTSCRSP